MSTCTTLTAQPRGRTSLLQSSVALIAIGLPSTGLATPPPRELTERAVCAASGTGANTDPRCAPDVQVTWDAGYENCIYGYHVGAGWGGPTNKFYDQVDRCAFLHDRGCWSVNQLTGVDEGNIGCSQDVNFMACIDAVEPQSAEEAEAKTCIQTTLLRAAADLCELPTIAYGRGLMYPLYTPTESSHPGHSCGDGQYAFHQLNPGQSLLAGQTILSSSGEYTLAMQTDGNAVVYDNYSSTAIWNSGTQGSGAVRLIMQTDGNLVIYTPTAAVWNTGTYGRGESQAVMQDDGNFVVYDETGTVTWNSKGF